MDAYRGSEQLFLRYRRGDEIFYAAGDLPGQLSLREATSGVSYDVPVVASMGQHHEGESWRELTKELAPIPVLDVQDWASLRQQLFGPLMTLEENQGLAVSFDRLDYFFFYDKAGNFRARRLIDMPPWYSVSGHVRLPQHFAAWQPVLDQFLQEAGIESDDVIFSTGDLDKGSIPFIYINTRSKLIVLVQYDELTENAVGRVPGMHLLQSFWHFFGSNTYTIIMRPFSSARSLISVLSGTAVETGRGLIPELEFDSPVPPVGDAPVMDRAAWEAHLDAELGRPASRGELRFLVGGETFYTRFIDALTSARESVDIRTYIFDTDDVALNIAELLKRRSREGVTVRVLFDGLGSLTASGEHPLSLPEDHRPPLSIENYLTRNSGVEVRKTRNTWLTGDHVKTMVIDKRLAFLGGMNIGREYRYDWHDMMVEVRGPVVDSINREFQLAWGQAGMLGDFSYLFNRRMKKLNSATGGYPVRLVYTKPGQDEIYRIQRDAILRARRYIYIENAYFTDDTLLRALVVARHRGVDVRVIIPLETDRGLITRNIMLAANTMLEQGIRVFIYPGFSHVKAAIFDGWASVGSANLDRLSLHINKEINIATSEPEAVTALRQELFEPDFARSKEMNRPFPERWTDHIIEMFGDYVF